MKIYEVFLMKEGKDGFRHAGSLEAPDDELAAVGGDLHPAAQGNESGGHRGFGGAGVHRSERRQAPPPQRRAKVAERRRRAVRRRSRTRCGPGVGRITCSPSPTTSI